MTEDQFQEVIRDMERDVARTSFGCSRECHEDFYFHAQALIDYLATIAEIEFFKSEYASDAIAGNSLNGEAIFKLPNCPCDMGERFFDESDRFRKRMEKACVS